MLRWFLFLAMMVSSIQPFSARSQSPAPKSGGTLRFGLSKDIQSINPFQRTTAATKNVASLAFECLLTFDDNDGIRPALATSWDVSKDGLQYAFRLRKGVQFHNGQEMTAQDVIWSMQYAMDSKNTAYGRQALSPIVSLSSPDPLTVRLTLREPYVPFLANLSSLEAFAVVPQGSVPPGREKMSFYPPGTGPFMMVDYKSNMLIAFKKFDQYWQKGLPYIREILFRPHEDDTLRFTALRAGEFDMVERVPYEQALRVQKGELKDVGLEPARAGGHRSIIFNTEKPPFHDKRVRQAMAYAIDKEKIMGGLTWGFGVVSDQKVLRESIWYVPLKERKRDLEKARALLREAGYPGGPKVKGQTEKRFEAEMQLIQSQVKEAGIDLELEFYDFAKHQASMQNGSYTITTVGGLTAIDPDLTYYKYFYSEKGPNKTHNYPRHSNLRLDQLLDAARTEFDSEKRYRLYKEAVEIIDEELPRISLGFSRYMFAFRTYVKGFRTAPNGSYLYGTGGLGMTWLDR